ncbi:MAG: hypothetical protein HY455_02040 [Parcubacteria group bacterium]|nr:hypothetical protein [Parcubacteria group bacterium]
MFALLESLKKKPITVRLRIAFGGALLITLILAIVWGFGLTRQLAEVGSVTSASDEEVGTMSPFEMIKSEFEDVLERY